MEFQHTSVLLKETVEGAFGDPSGVYADLTTGGGGHSLELAKRLSGGRLICFDRDGEAIEAAKKRLEGCPVTLVTKISLDYFTSLYIIDRKGKTEEEILEEV